MTGRIIRAADAPQREMRLGRGVVTDIVNAGIGTQKVDVHVNRLRADAAPGPYHRHTTSDNVYYVLSGCLTVKLDGVDHELSDGDVAFIPAGVPHSATNASAADVVLIEICAPGGADFIEVEPAHS